MELGSVALQKTYLAWGIKAAKATGTPRAMKKAATWQRAIDKMDGKTAPAKKAAKKTTKTATKKPNQRKRNTKSNGSNGAIHLADVQRQLDEVHAMMASFFK